MAEIENYLDLRRFLVHSGLGFLISSVSTGRSRRPSIPASDDSAAEVHRFATIIIDLFSSTGKNAARDGDREILNRECLD